MAQNQLLSNVRMNKRKTMSEDDYDDGEGADFDIGLPHDVAKIFFESFDLGGWSYDLYHPVRKNEFPAALSLTRAWELIDAMESRNRDNEPGEHINEDVTLEVRKRERTVTINEMRAWVEEQCGKAEDAQGGEESASKRSKGN